MGNGTGTNKIPLVELANLFSHLGANTKAQILSAFSEAQDMLNISNTANTGTQSRRQLSGLIDAPVLTTETNNRGFDVSWNRLDDRRIATYEVQVSFNNIFSNPDIFKVVDNSLALEGIGTTVYVRVRGIRFDGLTGNWSDVATVNAFATTAGPVVYSRGFDDIPSFYKNDVTIAPPGPIQHITITPERQNGGIVVFGNVALADGVVFQPGDSLVVKINSTVLDDIDIGSLSTHVGAFSNNLPMSIGFGPGFLTHEGFGFSAANDLTPGTASQSGAGIGTHVGWTNLANATGTMETVFPAAGTDYSQSAMSAGQSLSSKDLKLTNFGATVPGGNTITGIEVQFTGNFTLNGDPNKSYAFIRHMRLIDNTSTVQSFDQTTTQHWPYTTSTGAGDIIPSADFGGPTNLWGQSAGFWTPAKINSANFGVDVVAGFHVGATDATQTGANFSFDAILYGMTITVFSINSQLEAEVTVILNVTSGTLLGCTLNAVEFGSALT
jgi:hypothetical protein